MQSISKLNNFGVIHEYEEHISDFSNGTQCSWRSVSWAIVWFSTTGYKKTRLKHVHWWLLKPFYSKTTENGSILNLRPCPCNMILDELHPTYIRLINSDMVFAVDRVARLTSLVHYHSGVLCAVWWRRLPIPFTPSRLGSCRLCC